MIQLLQEIGWDENFDEIKNLKNLSQNPKYHPEGDVDIHTILVMNEAAKIAERENLSMKDKEILIYSALAHDFGKYGTTFQKPDKNGDMQWVSPGHEEQSGPMAEKFLKSIGANQKIIDHVVPLVQNHMQHIVFDNAKNKEAFVKKLAEKLMPSNIKMLNYLIEADHSGRHPLPKTLPEQAKNMAIIADQNNVLMHKHPDLLEGKDVIKYTGIITVESNIIK